MRQVWLVRHAIAAEAVADSNDESASDFDRPLTDKGRRKFRRLARSLVRQGQVPDLIVCSPLVRAVQTARVLAKAAGISKPEILVEEVLAPGVQFRRLDAFLKARPEACVALVGHEPDMSRSLGHFIGGGQVAFGKGHVACVCFDEKVGPKTGQLSWFVGPELAR